MKRKAAVSIARQWAVGAHEVQRFLATRLQKNGSSSLLLSLAPPSFAFYIFFGGALLKTGMMRSSSE